MPSALEDYLASLDSAGPAPAAPPAEAPGFFENLWSGLGGLGDLGLGALDVLDRPGRAVRHGFGALLGVPGASWGQAAEAFDPFNLITPSTPSQPIFSKDILEGLGVPEGPSVPILGSSRAIGGFFLDLLADPLTYTGVPGSSLAMRGLGKVGTKTVQGLDALRQSRGLLGTAAGGILGAGELLSSPLKFRNAPEYLGRDILRRDALTVGREIAELEDRAMVKRMTELRGQYPDADDKMLEFLSAPGSRTLLEERGLMPKSGLPEDFEITRFPLASDPENLLVVPGSPAHARDVALSKMTALDKATKIWEAMPKPLQAVAPIWFTGAPEVLAKTGQNFGKVAREQAFRADDILTDARYQAIIRKAGGEAHVIHARDPHGFAQAKVAELQKAMGQTGPMTGDQVEQLLTKAAKHQDVKIRALGGTLRDLNEAFPGAFYHNIDDIARAELRRFVPIDTTSRFVQELAKEPNVVKAAGLGEDAFGTVREVADDGFTVVDLSKLDKPMHKHFTTVGPDGIARPVQMRTEAWRDLSERILPRLKRDPSAQGVTRMLEGLTRYFQGWTTSLFPATWFNNLSGGVWNNWLMGGTAVAEEYGPAVQVLRGAARNPKGVYLGRAARQAEITTDLQARFTGTVRPDGTMDFGEFLREVREHKVVRGGFVGTELGEQLAAHAFDPITDQKTWAQKIADPALNPLTRAGYHVMSLGDDVNRLAHYLFLRKQGKSAAEAADSVKKWLYAGDTLTDAEKKLRYVMPFYGFARFNIPQQVRAMIERPTRFARYGRMYLAADRDGKVDVPDALLPDFVQSKMNVLTGRDPKGQAAVWALGRWIPYAQVREIDSPKKLVNFILSSLQPQVRAAVETQIGEKGWSHFFQRAISEYPGDSESFFGMRVNEKASHFLRTFRVLNEFDRTILPMFGVESGDAASSKIVDAVTGWERVQGLVTGKPYKIDFVSAKKRTLERLKREEGRMRAERKRLEAAELWSDVENVDRLLRKYRTQIEQITGWDPLRPPPARRAG